MSFLIDAEIRSGQQGHQDRRNAQHLDQRPGQRVVAGDLHRLAEVLLAVFMKAVPFVAFHGERLDDLDSLQRFVERAVDLRHLFHRPPIGPLERLRQRADRDGRQRCHQQRQQEQLPADPGRSGQAGDHLQRLADELAEQLAQAVGQAFHVVGKTTHQVARAFGAEMREIHAQRMTVERLGEVEDRQLHDARHEDRVDDQEHALQERAHQQQHADQHDGFESVMRQVGDDHAVA